MLYYKLLSLSILLVGLLAEQYYNSSFLYLPCLNRCWRHYVSGCACLAVILSFCLSVALFCWGDSVVQWLALRLMAQEVRGSTLVVATLQLPSEA